MNPMRPVIGISGDLKTDDVEVVRIKLPYVEAVRRAGGVPLVMPPLAPESVTRTRSTADVGADPRPETSNWKYGRYSYCAFGPRSLRSSYVP